MEERRQGPTGERFSSPSWALREHGKANEEVSLAMARALHLGPNDLAALDHLLEGGPLGPAELAERLGIRSASATALVDRLEAMGHVRREPHPSDRRRVAVVPTEHAVREAWGWLLPLIRRIDAVADELSPEEQRVIVEYLRRVTEVMRAYARGEG